MPKERSRVSELLTGFRSADKVGSLQFSHLQLIFLTHMLILKMLLFPLSQKTLSSFSSPVLKFLYFFKACTVYLELSAL